MGGGRKEREKKKRKEWEVEKNKRGTEGKERGGDEIDR